MTLNPLTSRMRRYGWAPLLFVVVGALTACSERIPPPPISTPESILPPVVEIPSAPVAPQNPPIPAAPPANVPEAEQQSVIAHSVLRSWIPGNTSRGLGLEILLEESDFTDEDLTHLLTTLSSGRAPVRIRIYTSKLAYEQELSGEFASEYKRGFLLTYLKIDNSDLGEIRWMQEYGDFAEKFGTTTKL